MKILSEQNIRKQFFCSICMRIPVFIFISLTLTCFSIRAASTKQIVLQLKWKHQFQFAGYYAAIEKGYYRDVGLEVVLKEWSPDISVEDEVVAGRSDFGVGMPDILIDRQHGKPVVVLAAIFQHSPLALFANQDSHIIFPQDLEGKSIMIGDGDLEIRAMLMNEGILKKKINVLPRTVDVDNLVNGKVDAVSGYLTDLPLILQEYGIHYSIIRPRTYGIDFYGDCLFTTEKMVREDPQLVENFLAASMKGWEYAMEHQEEIVDLIRKKYSKRLSKESLLYEARSMRELMLPDVVEIGHMNQHRWKHIADILVNLKMLPENYSLEGFIYNPQKGADAKIRHFIKILIYMLIVVTGLGIAGFILFIFNRKLKKAVKRQTKQLNDEKLFSDILIESLPGSFFVYEDGERLIRWNSTLKQESGYTDEELEGMHPLDWFSDEEKEKITDAIQVLSKKGKLSLEAEVTFRKTNKVVPYYHSASLFEMNGKKYLVGISLNTIEKKQLETQLIHAQKMESIGRLAGGIAHDFNNILTTILGYSELLLIKMDKNNPERKEISLIHDAGNKASALTSQLLSFSRKQILKKKTVSINCLVNDFLELLSKIVGEGISIKTSLKAEEGFIDADPVQIEQILMNLAVNGRDAMSGNGEIVFETEDITFDEEGPESHLNLKPGQYVVLTVTDSGEGMDKETLEHIFDPFFTTKEKGKGTGLGLATIYGIVKQHGGHIYAYSEENKGATFKIYFPASKKRAEEPSQKKRPASMLKGNERILIVDDESSIRKLIFDTLGPLGYRCITASDGNEALEVANKYNNDIDLLLTDIVMPGMNGRELSEQLLAEKPDMKVLFISGYSENVITHNAVLDTTVNYIPKPVTPITVTEKIRQVLDG